MGERGQGSLVFGSLLVLGLPVTFAEMPFYVGDPACNVLFVEHSVLASLLPIASGR